MSTSLPLSSTIGLLCLVVGLAMLPNSPDAQARGKSEFPVEMMFTEAGEVHELTFTGQSERAVLFFRVYDIAHYVEADERRSVSQATVVADGPSKAIVISFARKLGREQIQDEFSKSLRRNAQSDWLEQAEPTITAFINGIDRDAQPGDQMVFYWLAGGRIIAEFNGEREFGVTDTAFAKLIWSIWFGEEPACDREQLLASLTLTGSS